MWSGRRCGDREARSRGSYGEGSRGRCGEGARRSPRARVRARRRCGEGRVEDTWRCSCTITGRCRKTIEVSVRQVLHTVDEKPRGKSVRFPPHTKSSNSPCAPDASCSMQHAACSMQHAACSMQHAACSQVACNMLGATASNRNATSSMHETTASWQRCIVPYRAFRPTPRQSQAKEAPTNAPWQIRACPST